ncbi:MAG: stage II sporulation protein M [Chloroflexota bacterium]
MNFKRWLLVTVFLFVAGLLLGFITPPNATIGIISEQVTALGKFAEILAPLPKPAIAIFIFLKNVSAVLLSIVFSPVFCLLPIFVLISNGWVIGLISETVIAEKSAVYLLAGLLPHGIFEIPALIIGEATALSFGTAVLVALFKRRKSGILNNIKQNLKYLVLSVLLFLPAAIIETYITPLLLG